MPNTPNGLKTHSELTTLYSALTASEELAKVHSHDVSMLLHAADNVSSELDVLLSTDPVVQEVVREVKEAVKELQAAAGAVTTSAVELTQLAMYNRRWSLTRGADPHTRCALLQAPMMDCHSATGAITIERVSTTEEDRKRRRLVKKEPGVVNPVAPPAPPSEVVLIDADGTPPSPMSTIPALSCAGDLFTPDSPAFSQDSDLFKFIHNYLDNHVIVNRAEGPDSTTESGPVPT